MLRVEPMRAAVLPPGVAARTIVACLAIATALAARAAPNCREQLAEVDASLAAATGLDPQVRRALETFRDQGAQHCAAGRESSASAALQSVEMLLKSSAQASSQKAASAAAKKASRAQLTPGYLEGKWCATQKQNNERGLYVFSGDGTYRAGPATSNYGLVSGGSMSDFWKTYDAVKSKEPDRFVVTRFHYVTTFVRGQGACRPTAPRP